MQSGYLKVSYEHELYYEVFGKEGGIPILFLHGGPGIGFSDEDKRFFNPDLFRVVLFDQRGASRSKPFGAIENNTTDLLVADINSLLDYLLIKKVYVFGGSWGSTLALVYAIKNRERIIGMILRGIFLGNKAAINHYLNGGVAPFYPEEWARFIEQVPLNKRENIAKFYLEILTSNDKKISNKFAYEWAHYEISIFKKNLEATQIAEIVHSIPYKSLAILEAHYLGNDCFLEENFIFKYISEIVDIPITIIQGRFDCICPPIFAYQLHQHLKNSKLLIVDAGHSDSEPLIEKALMEALENIVSN